MIFALEQKPADAPALVDADAGSVVSYGELTARVGDAAARLRRDGRRLVFLLASNTVPSIIAYLACMEAGLPVCLIEAGPHGVAARLLETYQPELILEGRVPASLDNTTRKTSGPLHPDLALLLTTSGSTGNPKLVRLTKANVEANAASISGYLQIHPAECAMQSLPDPTVLVAFGARYLLTHGDALCVADTEYQAFRERVRDPLWQRDVLARPLEQRQALGQQLRVGSIERQLERGGDNPIDVDRSTALAWLEHGRSTTLIHGHTHRPASHALAPGQVRHVLSDWSFDHGQVGRADFLRINHSGLSRHVFP